MKNIKLRVKIKMENIYDNNCDHSLFNNVHLENNHVIGSFIIPQFIGRKNSKFSGDEEMSKRSRSPSRNKNSNKRRKTHHRDYVETEIISQTPEELINSNQSE